MKPERNSRRLFGITRAKGKMYEMGLAEESHISISPSDEPEALILLAVGTLGDVAAFLAASYRLDMPLDSGAAEELGFAASFFDAFLASQLSEKISHDVLLLASAAYYLAGRPGSSLVLARRIDEATDNSSIERLLRWILQAKWSTLYTTAHTHFGDAPGDIAQMIARHFQSGSRIDQLDTALTMLRERAYSGATPRDLMLVDLIVSIVRMRLAVSVWITVPLYTNILIERWAPILNRPEFPKELWPSQVMLGQAGLLGGASGVIQMPTSAGKTRSVEIILRSSFLSEKAKIGIVVAPFKALCHEIGTSLRNAFRQDNIKVNELSDAFQLDFLAEISELLGIDSPSRCYVLVLTPEKLLYVLRQVPTLANHVGLVVYDEGHQFDSGSRGITYELLLTEIKYLIPKDAQSVLVSAVIRNAQAVGDWLIGDGARVVNGNGLLPTARSVAFATWLERLGQLIFYETLSFERPDYFVPRVIESHRLNRLRGEKKDRFFPDKSKEKDAWKDVSLYLGTRLVPQGPVAIFCGRKDTAAGLAERAVDIYQRGYAIDSPAAYSNQDEIRRLKNLIDRHFGAESMQSRAAALGIFVHHGNTPHGLRLAIEHAMQYERIHFVVCTSTLAQGVNLPIRYLIVSGIYQAGERIKTRDFQNLIGRAGRAGMHTEGLVIFADPRVYDKRISEGWQFQMSVQLLKPENAEDTTSSLLSLLAPLTSENGKHSLPLSPELIGQLLLANENNWLTWTLEVESINVHFGFEAKSLLKELRRRKKLLSSVESYLMSNRGSRPFSEFRSDVQRLAGATLAYHIASADEKIGLANLFGLIADHVESITPSLERQMVYAKTLLGAATARRIDEWVSEKREKLLGFDSVELWLLETWPLFAEFSDDKFFHGIEPSSLPLTVAICWMSGMNYHDLIALGMEATKPWGEKQRRKLTGDDIVDFCENTLGFECSLVLAAVAQFLFDGRASTEGDTATLTLFQKTMKYGLPDWLSISCHERGFADRMIALALRDALRSYGYTEEFVEPALKNHWELIAQELESFPTYFESVLEGLQ